MMMRVSALQCYFWENMNCGRERVFLFLLRFFFSCIRGQKGNGVSLCYNEKLRVKKPPDMYQDSLFRFQFLRGLLGLGKKMGVRLSPSIMRENRSFMEKLAKAAAAASKRARDSKRA